MQHTGTIIKTLREKFGYSQDAVAKFLVVKREMISYYVTGARETPLGIAEKLADLFEVDLEIFFLIVLKKPLLNLLLHLGPMN